MFVSWFNSHWTFFVQLSNSKYISVGSVNDFKKRNATTCVNVDKDSWRHVGSLGPNKSNPCNLEVSQSSVAAIQLVNLFDNEMYKSYNDGLMV